MRGARLQRLGDLAAAGIIPAYAGSTAYHTVAKPKMRDHPRVCGEHRAMSTGQGRIWGSSPRMRGAPRRHRDRQGLRGIIPAYAGSTARPRRGRRRPEDHPRVCGEHITTQPDSMPVEGSSPRMRGARRATRRATRRGGIIPAYAGSTLDEGFDARASRDHPRVCGEH